MGSVKEAVCCTIHGRGTCGSPLHVHYCDLHASAPDLLAALKGFLHADPDVFAAELAAARAAIKKAEGATA